MFAYCAHVADAFGGTRQATLAEWESSGKSCYCEVYDTGTPHFGIT